jgi:hypothetical protein
MLSRAIQASVSSLAHAGVWGRKTTTPGVDANEYGCANFFRILNFSDNRLTSSCR